MGIVFSFLEFFDTCHHQQALRGPMLALGSLEINEPAEEIAAFAVQHPSWHRDCERQVQSLFRDRYGVTEYRDCDLNDKADIRLDLNQPLAPELLASALTIVNGGTVEHVFDVAQAMENMHEMARPGATIIHLAPLSWYNHGYYNFNPRLFTAIAEANQYRLVAEAFWLDALAAARLYPGVARSPRRGLLQSVSQWLRGRPPQATAAREAHAIRGLAHPALYMTFDGQKYTPYCDLVRTRLFATDFLPANALYLVAYQKLGAKSFVFPYDIQA